MIYIGTSGWSYPAFTEKLYKQKMSSLDQLTVYSSVFNSVEINYSFYHVPKSQSFKNWFSTTPERFVFSVKLNRLFTHESKLRLAGDTAETLGKFLQNAGELQHKFKILLVQIPPTLQSDPALLKDFLEAISGISKNMRFVPSMAFEFRHQTWFNEKTYSLLRTYQASLVISQSSVHPERHLVLSNLLYLRLHGPEKLFDSSYSAEQLKFWADFIKVRPDAQSYIYFNNTMRGQAVQNALDLEHFFRKH
jgi:uncharacterized protein YecE (DUF72 family)